MVESRIETALAAQDLMQQIEEMNRDFTRAHATDRRFDGGSAAVGQERIRVGTIVQIPFGLDEVSAVVTALDVGLVHQVQVRLIESGELIVISRDQVGAST